MATITRGEAYSILELPIGADPDAIRTSYKRLAQKWHPEKNPNSDAVLKFQQINQAYAALNQANGTTKLTSMEEMYAQYQQVMYPKNRHAMLDDDYDSSGDPDSCTTSDSENDPMSSVFSYFGSSANRRKQQQDHGGVDLDNDVPLTAEQREQLANELITEEEKKKRQLEKRRLKKKQRREKKRLEKQSVEPAKPESAKKSVLLKEQMSTAKVKKEKINDAQQQQQQHDYLETQDDDSMAFSDSSRKNLETAARLKNEGNHSSPVKNKEPGAPDEVDPVIIRSRQFAIQGNNMACTGQYPLAIEYFTKAIQLDSSDYRFYGNRSYCYERLDQFDKALKDANKAVSLAPDWPKGYFRKGRALLGLKNYSAAEEAFMQVLKLDSKCEDARQELNRVRTCQLMEMGFSEVQAQNAVRQFDSVQQALDSLLAGLVSENPALGDVYFSDEDDVVPAQQQQQQRPAGLPTQQPTQSKPVAAVTVPAPAKQPGSNSVKPTQSLPPVPAAKNSHKKKEPLPPIPQHHYEEAARQIKQSRAAAPAVQVDSFKMDPNNPEGLTSLWVGNVQPTVTQEVLYEMFSKYGMLQSVRILPEKFCAFVNYVDKDCAGRAMHGLQGNMCAGSPLLIKFPDNPVTANSGSSLPEKPVKSSAEPVKTAVPVQTLSKVPAPVNATSAVANTKLRGPVNGDECYFWRTTGCQFTTGCRYRHVPENKGIDKKPWQRVAK